MLRESGVEISEPWGMERGGPGDTDDWRFVDGALRAIASRRAELDAEEARLLRAAEAMRIWRQLGMVSAFDYLERVLGYGPRTAKDRLRVARALGSLPELTDALARGELAYSAIRELTRIVTPTTEAAWRAKASGKTLREIEALVAGRRPGDLPEDAPDPELRPRVVRLELSAETFALFRQARGALDDRHGRYLDDDELMAALCEAALEGRGDPEPRGRAKYQIAMTVCARCRQGWQHGGGALIAIGAAALERAGCDAQHIGSVDAAVPARAHQAIPPSVARLVWRRDHGRCRVPGCRSSRGLELHHLTHRADGGSHDASNLILACSSCHLAHHEGRLTIGGTAESIEVRRAGEVSRGVDVPHARAHVGTPPGVSGATPRVRRPPGAAKPDPSSDEVHRLRHRAAPVDPGVGRTRNDELERVPHVVPPGSPRVFSDADHARALVRLGWAPAIARAAVAGAVETLGRQAPVEQRLAEALRRCRGSG